MQWFGYLVIDLEITKFLNMWVLFKYYSVILANFIQLRGSVIAAKNIFLLVP